MDGIKVHLLDGINNFGFSGSPAICFDKETNGWTIYGVVSGFLHYSSDVKNKKKKKRNNLEVNQNSGITYIYDTGYVIEIINQNFSTP